jgi:hypothetical protein
VLLAPAAAPANTAGLASQRFYLALGNARYWAVIAVVDQFKYWPSHFRAKDCAERNAERFGCRVSWRHSRFSFRGVVEVGKVNPVTSHFNFGMRVVRTNRLTHRHVTITVPY